MKTTKRALFSSVMALILCFSMLVGTTFAWFTDSVESGVNQIIAGNLDIELYHEDKQVTNTYDKLFKDIKWEPGVVAYENITVANEGTLALKYQLGINFTDATTNANGDTLAKVLKVGFVKGGIQSGTREGALDEVSAWLPLESFVQSGKLLPENYNGDPVIGASQVSDTYGIVIYWQPSDIDNEFNMNNENRGKVMSINLGIKLLATQLEAEDDSFDETYDEDAWVDGWQVYNAQDLQAALNNGETNIVLMDDIELTESIVIPAPAATTYSLRTAATVIDLNGNEITSNLTSGRAILVQGAAEIKNGTITTTNGVGAIFATGKSASLILTGMTVAVTGTGTNKEWILTAVGAANGAKVVINNGTYSAEKGYGLVVSTTGADVTINDGIFTTEGTTESAAVRFDSGWDNSKVYTKAVINGGVFNAPEGGFAFTANNAYGKDITINGGTFNGKVASHYQDNGVVINGGIFNDKLFEGGNHTDKYQIKGGTFSFDPTKRVAEGYEAKQNTDGSYSVVIKGETLTNSVQAPNAEVYVPAGTYTFPSNVAEGVVINCAPGTVFEGTSKLNINGATVIGATFSNPNGTAADQTINGTFKNCVFEGKNGLRWCYAGDTVVFEDCVFSGSTYGVHFDGGANKVVFRRCTISGFNAMGGAVEMATFEDCTFKSNGKSGYNGINMWGNTEMTDCTFVFDGSASYEWVDAVGSNMTYTFTNCIVTDGKTEKGIETVVGNYGVGNTIIINGETLGLVSDKVVLDADLAAGKDVVMTSDMKFNASETTANSGYGATGVSVKGGILDGNGHSLGINNWGTWDAAVHTTGGTIKNLTINSGMRGIFMGSATADVYIDNVIINGTIYTFNSDGGNKEYGVYISNSTLNGWTSHSDVHKEVVYTNCSFGEGQGYAFCRPYGPTKFVGCNFSEGYTVDPIGAVTFENCTIGGVALTAENLATLVTSNIGNANVK